MKLALITGLALGSAMAIHAAGPPAAFSSAVATPAQSAEAASVLKTDTDKFSYSIGLTWGTSMRQQAVEISPEVMLRGLRDGLSSNTPPLMTPEEVQKVQDEMRKTLMSKRETMMNEMRSINSAAADKFLADNAKKPGVKTMEDGLQYKVIKEGTGPKPTAKDTVSVQYRGTLLNGKEFDASSRRGPEPASFPVTGVIKGWTEALTNMNVGSKWELYVPPKLAYGESGSRNIEPNSLLTFEVELVAIKKPEPPPQPVTSDIIKVPSKAEMDAGAKIEILKPEDVARMTKSNQTSGATAPKPPSPK